MDEDDASLVAAALSHPQLAALGLSADAAAERARATTADRLPSLTLGADYVAVGPAPLPNVPDSGKDAIVASVGLSVPLWQRATTHDIAAMQATADASRAAQRGAGDRTVADLAAATAAVRDSGRRATVVSQLLLPQANAAYASILGNYAAGRSQIAQTLLAQQELLDLGLELAVARADHQRAWARLSRMCGREIDRRPLGVAPPEALP